MVRNKFYRRIQLPKTSNAKIEVNFWEWNYMILSIEPFGEMLVQVPALAFRVILHILPLCVSVSVC